MFNGMRSCAQGALESDWPKASTLDLCLEPPPPFMSETLGSINTAEKTPRPLLSARIGKLENAFTLEGCLTPFAHILKLWVAPVMVG